MADTVLRFLLVAKDNEALPPLKRVGASVKDVGTKIDGTTGKMKKLETQSGESAGKTGGAFKRMSGVVSGALGAAGVFSFLKDSAQGWADHQKLLRQTAAVMKSTAGVAGMTTTSMGNLSDSIEANTGVDGDNVLQGENMLATFTNIHNQAGKGNDIFTQSTKIMTDMSVAMGTDMKGQAIQLGKALNDPIKGIGALSKVGVTFTDQQKKQIATMVKAGDTAGAQRVILKELSHEFGGSAKAQETSGQKMGVAFHNLQDSVGQMLVPMFTKVAGIITNYVIPAFQAAISFGQKHKKTIEILGVALGVLGGIFLAAKVGLAAYNVVQGVSRVLSGEAAAQTTLQTVALGVQKVALGLSTAAQWAFNAALNANPIALIVVGIAALTAGIIWIATKTKFFQELWHAAWGGIKAAFSGVFNFIKDHWKLILAILSGPIGLAVLFISSHWQAIKDGFKKVVGYIGDKVGSIVGFITGIPGRIGGVIASIGRIGARMGVALWHGIHAIVGDVGGFGKSLYNAVAQSVNWLIDKIKNWHFTIGAFGVHHTFKPFGGIPDIPYMAKGGIVTRPTLAMIGEAGTEAVVPLNRARDFGFGAGGHGGGDVYNISLSVLGDAKSAARALLAELQRLKGSGVQVNLG